MGETTKVWYIVFIISLVLIIAAAAIHTGSTVSIPELTKGRLVVRTSSTTDIVVSVIGFFNWILLPLSVIMLYVSLGKEKRWYEIMVLYGFILTAGVLYLITSLLPMLSLGSMTETIINIFLGKFLYMLFVPMLVILFFTLFESMKIIMKLE